MAAFLVTVSDVLVGLIPAYQGGGWRARRKCHGVQFREGCRLQQYGPDALCRNGKVVDLFRAEATPAPFACTPSPVEVRGEVSPYAALRLLLAGAGLGKGSLRFEASVVNEMATMAGSKGRLWARLY